MPTERNYEKRPAILVKTDTPPARGWNTVVALLLKGKEKLFRGVLVVDCYPGADRSEIADGLRAQSDNLIIFDPASALRPSSQIETMVERFLTNDRVFGYMSPFRMEEFFDDFKLEELRAAVRGSLAGHAVVVVLGVGAALVTEGDRLVIADMPRWEIQRRFREGMSNWSIPNPNEDFLRKYKRGYFVEWRTGDRHKLSLFGRAQFFLDTTTRNDPKLVAGDLLRRALDETTRRPFRVVPFFDPGVWGGQWMRQQFDLPEEPPNFAWGFDCVPEENSLLFDFSGVEFETPSLNLVMQHPKALLGSKVYSRFGAEFPIRFDFLDTMDGGNLSLQVHPTTEYVRQTFGLAYTQDESYYILDARPDASVYLGLRQDITAEAFFKAIDQAQAGGPTLDVEKFVCRWPAARHDHFSIPAGTVHCAGSNSVVLEISATPYIFTFKLWDWGRLGLDGLPRPVHIEHGRNVLQPDQDENWVERTILSSTEPIASGDGWREERTGLHEVEFIETRRHWFSKPVLHDTNGSVQVLNLVQGDRATIESPTGAFDPFGINFAETVIIPAGIGAYRIVPENASEHATIRASVRV